MRRMKRVASTSAVPPASIWFRTRDSRSDQGSATGPQGPRPVRIIVKVMTRVGDDDLLQNGG